MSILLFSIAIRCRQRCLTMALSTPLKIHARSSLHAYGGVGRGSRWLNARSANGYWWCKGTFISHSLIEKHVSLAKLMYVYGKAEGDPAMLYNGYAGALGIMCNACWLLPVLNRHRTAKHMENSGHGCRAYTSYTQDRGRTPVYVLDTAAEPIYTIIWRTLQSLPGRKFKLICRAYIYYKQSLDTLYITPRYRAYI